MNENNLLEWLVASGLAVMLAAVGRSALKLLQVYLEKKTAEILETTKLKKIQGAVLKAQEHVWAFVNQISQEVADDLKLKAADGKLTAEEQTELQRLARERTLAALDAETIALLKDYTNDLQLWLNAQIDSYSRASKVSNNCVSIVSPTITPPA